MERLTNKVRKKSLEKYTDSAPIRLVWMCVRVKIIRCGRMNAHKTEWDTTEWKKIIPTEILTESEKEENKPVEKERAREEKNWPCVSVYGITYTLALTHSSDVWTLHAFPLTRWTKLNYIRFGLLVCLFGRALSLSVSGRACAVLDCGSYAVAYATLLHVNYIKETENPFVLLSSIKIPYENYKEDNAQRERDAYHHKREVKLFRFRLNRARLGFFFLIFSLSFESTDAAANMWVRRWISFAS